MRSVVTNLACFVLAAFFLACSPALREGHFGCEDGLCPEGWICRDDRLCWLTEQSVVHYQSCTQNSACDTGFCARGPMNLVPIGQCSQPCANDAACPPRGSDPSTCAVEGYCAGGCGADAPCGEGLECYVQRLDAAGNPLGACAPTGEFFSGSGIECTVGDGSCFSGTICLAREGSSLGLCALPCGPGYACESEETCTTLESGDSYCFILCDSPGVFCEPMECAELTPGQGEVCVPVGLR